MNDGGSLFEKVMVHKRSYISALKNPQHSHRILCRIKVNSTLEAMGSRHLSADFPFEKGGGYCDVKVTVLKNLCVHLRSIERFVFTNDFSTVRATL